MRIHLSAPDVGALEERFVRDALRSGWVAPVGPDLEAFESEVAARAGVAHAVAVSSGTAALHLAMLELGVNAAKVVVVPTLTFAATANAAVYTGARPVFVDSDPATGCVDIGLLEELLRSLRAQGREIGAVVPVDLFGSCADYTSLLPLCAEYEVPVIADAAEALGASHAGAPAGSFGRVAALSFNGNKIMTTSSGGMLVSDDGELLARCRYLAGQARQPVAHYEHTEIGYNYRLSNVLAALGRAQLSRLDAMMERRRLLRELYAKAFAGLEGVRLLGADDVEANCWLTTVVVEPDLAGWRADELGTHLADHDIETRPIWKPMHLQPVFAGSQSLVTGAAERLFETGLVLPSGSSIDDEQVARVLHQVATFVDSRR